MDLKQKWTNAAIFEIRIRLTISVLVTVLPPNNFKELTTAKNISFQIKSDKY